MRRGCEMLIGLALLTILLRGFVVQGLLLPVQVSAGSMAETWLGPHREFDCGHCGFTYRCGTDRPPRGVATICPNCKQYDTEFESQPLLPGDSLLIDRAAFELREPRRWDVAVFRCPENAALYCIKRIVGLPGESIQLRSGDVYVNGAVARKPMATQRACRQLVHDSQFLSRELSIDTPVWKTSPTWQHQTNSASFVHFEADAAANEAAEIDWLSFYPGRSGSVTDDYAYNQGESRRLSIVRDLMLTGTLAYQRADRFWIEARGATHRHAAVLDLANGQAELLADGEPMQRAAWSDDKLDAANPGSGTFEFEFSTFDQQVLLAIDGRVIFAHPIEAMDGAKEEGGVHLSLGAEHGRCQVSKLRVWRDIYYTHPGPGRGHRGLESPYELAGDEVFVLGDNSPISDDSRTSVQGGVPVRALIGKPLVSLQTSSVGNGLRPLP